MDLWKKDSFINNNILYLFNKEIFEYDMKDGGLSLIREYKLLPDDKIKKLLSYGDARVKGGAKKHTVEEGKMQIKDPVLKEGLKKGFETARMIFFEENELDTNDIISIKKDAIFVSKRCTHQKFGEYINFREKHSYSSYIRLGRDIEIYYNPYDTAVKGIGKTNLPYHEDYMVDFIKRYCNKMETSSTEDVLRFITRFIDRYKKRELEIGYYRNFNKKSNYIINDERDIVFMVVDEEDKDRLDISYNLFNILLKLLKIPL